MTQRSRFDTAALPRVGDPAAAARGLLMLTCGAHMNVVRMIPPLVITAEEIDEGLAVWADVLAEV